MKVSSAEIWHDVAVGRREEGRWKRRVVSFLSSRSSARSSRGCLTAIDEQRHQPRALCFWYGAIRAKEARVYKLFGTTVIARQREGVRRQSVAKCLLRLEAGLAMGQSGWTVPAALSQGRVIASSIRTHPFFPSYPPVHFISDRPRLPIHFAGLVSTPLTTIDDQLGCLSSPLDRAKASR